jgi:hypothetical protein
MKKLHLILVFLLVFLVSFGFRSQQRQMGIIGQEQGAAGETYDLMEETFETTPGADLTWAENGTIDDDYTTIILAGSESCLIDGVSNIIHEIVSPTDSKVYFAQLMRGSAATVDNKIMQFQLRDSANNEVAAINVNYSTGCACWDSMKIFWMDTTLQNENVDTTDIAITDKFYLKIEYDNHATAATASFFYAIDSAGFPGWTQLSGDKTGLVSANQADDVKLRSDDAGTDYVVDQIRGSTSDIVSW